MSRVVHTNIWSAYGYARKAGYEGTEEEFEQGLKKSAEAAGNAEESASTASEAATEAEAARDAAAQSAENASTSEDNALEYANSAAQVLRDAQAVAQTVNVKATEAAGSASRAENYAQTATTKASEATTAAGTATSAASSASGSAQAADASATAAAASETNAAASASSASTSAGSASESADEAAASAAAAQEVKDSIPADYSQLSADVTDLKSQLNDGYERNNYTWQRGGMNRDGITSQLYRIVTSTASTAVDDIIIKNKNNTYTFEVWWTKDGITTASGWKDVNDGSFYKVPSGSTFSIIVRKASEDYISLSATEVAEMSGSIYVASKLETAYRDISFSVEASMNGNGEFDETDFIIGTYYANGSYYRDSARVCTKKPLEFSFDTIISVNSGYRMAINFLNSQGDIEMVTGFVTSDIVVPKEKRFHLIIDNGNTSATANVPLYASQVLYKTPLMMDIDSLKGTGSYFYDGADIKPKHHGFNTSQMAWSYTSPTSQGTYTPQAMSYSNGVVFKCWKNDLIQLYDFDNGTKIAEYAITSEHGDCMDFSNEYYDNNDEFPLAYFTSDTSPLKVYVNRLTRSSGVLVRTLQFPIELAGYYAGHAVDAENNRIVTLGYTENSFETNPNGTNYMICVVWDLNNLTQNQDYTYTPALLKSFTLPFMICTQDQCYYNNKMFVISSNFQNTSTVIYVVDIGEESVVATLSDIPYKAYETEGIFWVGSDMYVNGNGITKYTFV